MGSWLGLLTGAQNIPQDIMEMGQNAQAQALQNQQAYAYAAQQASQLSQISAPAIDERKQAHILLRNRLQGVNGKGFTVDKNDFLFPLIHGEKVYIFFLHGDRVGHLEDEKNMFPSDKLVTQLRLLWS
jgi:hypothetical protein